MARGDIAIAAVVEAGAAAYAVQALVLGVLISGLFAVGFLIVRRSGRASMPYGPGLCVGGLATLFLCWGAARAPCVSAAGFVAGDNWRETGERVQARLGELMLNRVSNGAGASKASS